MEEKTISELTPEQLTELKTKQYLDNLNKYIESLVVDAGTLKNLIEFKEGEQIFYTSIAVFRIDSKVYFEFGTAVGEEGLKKQYKKYFYSKEKELIDYKGFYKSNDPNNAKKVMNYYIMLYKLQSEFLVYNKKCETLIF